MKRMLNDRDGCSHAGTCSDQKRPKKLMESVPRRVVFICGLPNEITEAEVVQLGLPFGRMSNLVLARKKNQALLEMADLDSAQAMVEYYSERPPSFNNRSAIVRFSNYEELKTDDGPVNAGAKVALKAADELLDNVEEPHSTLRVVIDNMIYPITLDVLHKIFSKFGQVLRIVTYMKNEQLHAFIEYNNAVVASAAKSSLNGQNIYNGCCTLRVDFSNMRTVTVKYNNDKMRDYTNPGLPSGDGNNGMSSQHGRLDVGQGRLDAGPLMDVMLGDGRFASSHDMRRNDDLSHNRGTVAPDLNLLAAANLFGGNLGALNQLAQLRGLMGGVSLLNSDNLGLVSGLLGGVGGLMGVSGLAGNLDRGRAMSPGRSSRDNDLQYRRDDLRRDRDWDRDGDMRHDRNWDRGQDMRRDRDWDYGEEMRRARDWDREGDMRHDHEWAGRVGRNTGWPRGIDEHERAGDRGERERREVGLSTRDEGRHQAISGCVLLVSSLNEDKITPDNIFKLFGVYGNVQRVKILFNKKDSALIEFAEPDQAVNACQNLNRVKWWGKEMCISPSKHPHIQAAKPGLPEAWLTKDFTDSKLHRYRTPNSKNYRNIYPPSATLHLSNIAPDTTEEKLVDLFCEFGRIRGFKFFPRDKKMALIQMNSVEEAIVALVSLHDYELGPKSHLRVSFTNTVIRD